MAKQPKRDKAYYEERLLKDYPAYYVDYINGKYRTITEAAIACGLKTSRTRLLELKNAWQKASANERREFENWLHTEYGVITPHPTASATGRVAIANGRQLLPWAKSRIQAVMTARGLKVGALMKELGFSPLNASLGQALKGDTQLQPALITALENWLEKNKHI